MRPVRHTILGLELAETTVGIASGLWQGVLAPATLPHDILALDYRNSAHQPRADNAKSWLRLGTVSESMVPD